MGKTAPFHWQTLPMVAASRALPMPAAGRAGREWMRAWERREADGEASVRIGARHHPWMGMGQGKGGGEAPDLSPHGWEVWGASESPRDFS